MEGKTCDFRRSLMTKMMLDAFENEGYFDKWRAKLPGGETVSLPGKDYAVVFRDFFTCGLGFIPSSFLRDVLEEFNVQIHQLTPNGIATLSKFAWACESYRAAPDIDSFCSFYELQKQPKKAEGGLVA